MFVTAVFALVVSTCSDLPKETTDGLAASAVVTSLLEAEDSVFSGNRLATDKIAAHYADDIISVSNGTANVGINAFREGLREAEQSIAKTHKDGIRIKRVHKMLHIKSLTNDAVAVTVRSTSYFSNVEFISLFQQVSAYILVRSECGWIIALETTTEAPPATQRRLSDLERQLIQRGSGCELPAKNILLFLEAAGN